MLLHQLAAPAKIYIDITAKCNLRCIYCYHFDSPSAVLKDCSTAEWTSFIEEASRAGVMGFNISGGEALLRPDLFEILEEVGRNRIRYELVTNGLLLTADHAAKLAAGRRCDFVQISLDGPEAVHDAARGRGSYAGAVRAINHLREHGVPVRIRATIGKHNLGTLEETAALFFDELGLKSFTTNCVAIEGLCHKEARNLELSLDDLLYSIEEHRRVLERYPGRLLSSTGPWGLYLKWRALYHAWESKSSRGCYAGHLGGCGAVFKQMGVRADGVMVPCVQLPEYEMGRINETPLLEAWNNSLNMVRIRRRREVELSIFPECRDCEYMGYCFGGCPANSAVDEHDRGKKVCKFCLKNIANHLGSAELKHFLA